MVEKELALPAEGEQSKEIKPLASGLGNGDPIVSLRLSAVLPKPSWDLGGESAATDGNRSGADIVDGSGNLSGDISRLLARVDQVARRIDPAHPFFSTVALPVLELADALAPDADLEPSLGWPASHFALSRFDDPDGAPELWDDACRDLRSAYAAVHCLDLEDDFEDEPSLGALECHERDRGQLDWSHGCGSGGDYEQEHDGREPEQEEWEVDLFTPGSGCGDRAMPLAWVSA